jgi:hypothetical protein
MAWACEKKEMLNRYELRNTQFVTPDGIYEWVVVKKNLDLTGSRQLR